MSLAESTHISKPSSEEVYQALLRALRRRKGFGIVFVQCVPTQATQLIARVKHDLPQKNIAVLNLAKPIDNLYQIIEDRSDKNELDILFVQGLEKSLEPYIKPGYGGEGDYYNLDTVPRILSNLNQQRENFRDHFNNICFVFTLPLFGIKYFIRRAPDFFDWSSGAFVFPTDLETLKQESSKLIQEGWMDYISLTPDQRKEKLLELEDLIYETDQNLDDKADLLVRQGMLFQSLDLHEEGLACHEKALVIKPERDEIWRYRGDALLDLSRYEEAISSYDKALQINPNEWRPWYGRGVSLQALKRYEEAVASYDKALELEPDFYYSWSNRGGVMKALGRLEEAIVNYDKAIEIAQNSYKFKFDPNLSAAWLERGDALDQLGRLEEAITSYNKALEIKSDLYEALYYKASCYAWLGNFKLALENLRRAIELNPNEVREWAKTNPSFNNIKQDKRFQELIGS